MMSEHPTAPGQDPVRATTGDSDSISIRRVRLGDLRAVAAVQRASFRRGLAYGMGALITLWLVPPVAFLVAIDDATERIIGCGIADRSRGSIRVMNLAVHPAFRRRGVGRRLLAALEAAFPPSEVLLMVEEWNTGARALYEANEFIQIGFYRNYYGRNHHGIWMKKPRYGVFPSSSPPEERGGRIIVPHRSSPSSRPHGEPQHEDAKDDQPDDAVQDRHGS